MISDHERIALAVAPAATGRCWDRQCLGTVGRLLPGWFAPVPDQSPSNRRPRRLTPWMTTVPPMVAARMAAGEVRLVDGTPIACANDPGRASRRPVAGHASYGDCPAQSPCVGGVRRVLIADRKGVPVGDDRTGPQTGQARERAPELAAAHAGSLRCADTGLWGRAHLNAMELVDVRLITPERHRLPARPPSAVANASIRLVIASLFSNRKRQLRLDHHRANTLPGLVQRIAQRRLALTLEMLNNLLTARPAHALAAYDRR